MYIDDVGVAASADKAIGDVAAGIASFANAAGSGAFAISESGGEAMMRAITGFREDLLLAQQTGVERLLQRPQLGDSPGAQVVAPHIQRSGETLERSVRQLLDVLKQLEEAIRKAKAAYVHTDTAGGQTVKGVIDV